jgi:two-component system sensor kinase FixL
MFVLFAVALLIVVDQAVVQPLLIRLDRFAPAINLAGRQRMLSQRLTKAALITDRATSEQAIAAAREELQTTLAQWSAAHEQLRHDVAARNFQRISSPAIRVGWKELQPHYDTMVVAAEQVSKSNGFPLTAAQKTAVAEIVEHEAQFLTAMDSIVKLMESEANREVQYLRASALGIAATIVGLIVGLGWFVVRPATHAIRAQVDDLETRVQERTAALATTLDNLKFEIVEREKAESKNQRLAAQLAHADRVESIGHLTVGLAHELNHPLATIANYAEACNVLLNREEHPSRPKLANFVTQIRDESLHAGKIVRRMRNFVQPHTSEISESDVRDLIDEIVALCLPELERCQVSVQTQFHPAPLRVNVDAIQIQQVLVNLVQNAIQSMANIPADQRAIIIRTTCDKDQIRVDVTDTGTGFNASDTEQIFSPFTTTKADGLGVGLSICRSIIENHHGTIWAESSLPRGAVVSFTLPLASPHDIPKPRQTYSLCC